MWNIIVLGIFLLIQTQLVNSAQEKPFQVRTIRNTNFARTAQRRTGPEYTQRPNICNK